MNRPQHNDEKPTILVAGVGNIFLSDDGFGPEVVRHLAADHNRYLRRRELVDYGIRGMHLAYDLLEGYAALVLIDARPGSGAAGDLVVLEIGPMMSEVGSSTLTGWIRSRYWPRCQTSVRHSPRPIWSAAARPSLTKESA